MFQRKPWNPPPVKDLDVVVTILRAIGTCWRRSTMDLAWLVERFLEFVQRRFRGIYNLVVTHPVYGGLGIVWSFEEVRVSKGDFEVFSDVSKIQGVKPDSVRRHLIWKAEKLGFKIHPTNEQLALFGARSVSLSTKADGLGKDLGKVRDHYRLYVQGIRLRPLRNSQKIVNYDLVHRIRSSFIRDCLSVPIGSVNLLGGGPTAAGHFKEELNLAGINYEVDEGVEFSVYDRAVDWFQTSFDIDLLTVKFCSKLILHEKVASWLTTLFRKAVTEVCMSGELDVTNLTKETVLFSIFEANQGLYAFSSTFVFGQGRYFRH